MREDTENFIVAALEASVYIRPREPGLTADEIREVATLAGFKRGQIDDALADIHRRGIRREGTRLRLTHMHGMADFISRFDTDHRSPDAFQFVREHLKELAAEHGRSKARIERNDLVSVGTNKGLDPHDVELAITVLTLNGILDTDGTKIVHNQTNEIYAMPLQQIEQNININRQVPARKRPLINESYELLKNVLTKRPTSASPNSTSPQATSTPTPAGRTGVVSSDRLQSPNTTDTHEKASPMQKPRILIGSSREEKDIAEHIQLGLEHDAECTIWWQGVFGLSGGNLDSLIKASKQFEFAVLVLTPDDLVHKRGEAKNSPRDNVLFELGLFMGALGREKTYIVYNRDEKPDLPTDLAGVTPADFAKHSDGNLSAAIGPVCTKIKIAIKAAQTSKSSPQMDLP